MISTHRWRYVLGTSVLLLVLAVAAVVGLRRGDGEVADGPLADVELSSSGRIVVTEDGAVVDRMDVAGPIWVKANDVRISSTRVSYAGDHAIRIFPGFTGTVIEDGEVRCGSERTKGIVFGHYTARRVTTTGCRRAFETVAGDVRVVDSRVDGEEVNLAVGTSPDAPASGADTEQAPAPTAAPSTTGPGDGRPPPARADTSEADRERAAIIRKAGPTDRSTMRRSGTITVTEDGATIEDVRVSGAIIVRADDVTIRNCDVRGYSNSALIRTHRGFSGTHVEHCYLEAVPGPDGEATNGVVLGGAEIYVGHSEITGYADGIKAESRSTYEANHIHMTKPPGSEKHLDGIQASGDTEFTIRGNVIDVPAASGGNSAIFVQPWNGTRNYEISDIVIEENHLRGGNFTVFLMGGEHMRDVTFTDNTFAGDGHRYGHSRVNNCAAVTSRGNVLDDGGPVEGTC